MAPRFVDYYGNTVTFDNDHTHVVEDTINTSGTTAVVTSSTDGFFSTTDKLNLNTVENQILLMADKIKQAVYIKPISPSDVALTFNSSTSNLMSQVYDGTASDGLVVNVSAKEIGTLTYSWNGTWYYKGPNWEYNDIIQSGLFSNIKSNTISASVITNLGSQPYSVIEGTVTITNTVETMSSRITESFSIYFL